MWHKYCLVFILLISSLFVAKCAGANLSRTERLADTETLISIFEHRYGPREWKENYWGISFTNLGRNLRCTAENAPDDLEFYIALNQYATALKDPHTRISIPSTLTASLGFGAIEVGNYIVVSEINRNVLTSEKFPFEKGDILMSMNGRNMNQALEELAAFRDIGNEMSKRRFLATLLTERPQESLILAPSGESTLEIYSVARGRIETVSLPWLKTGYELAQTTNVENEMNSSADFLVPSQYRASKESNPLGRLRDISMGPDNARILAEAPESGPSFPVWQSFTERNKSPLYTGIATVNGRHIGYIRVNKWSTDNYAQTISFLEREIPYLEANTGALIVDERYNPGGMICYQENFISFFLNQPATPTLFRLKANRTWLIEYEKIAIDPSTSEGDMAILEVIITEIRAALARGDSLTTPMPICSFDSLVHPHQTADGALVAYTKPVIVLVNEFSASASDAFAATMQDLGRAKIFGTGTMGAGGSVIEIGPIGFSDFTISLTESLMYRSSRVMTPKGMTTNYIENVGVNPDFFYDVTIEDYLGNFEGYRTAIENALDTMLTARPNTMERQL